jgi:hypothetical protein
MGHVVMLMKTIVQKHLKFKIDFIELCFLVFKVCNNLQFFIVVVGIYKEMVPLMAYVNTNRFQISHFFSFATTTKWLLVRIVFNSITCFKFG